MTAENGYYHCRTRNLDGFIVCGPLLLLALVVGIIVSIFQATTQIQEQTLAFVPKIVAVLAWIDFFWTMDAESITVLYD